MKSLRSCKADCPVVTRFNRGEGVVLATYDDRLAAAARGLGFALVA